MLKTTESEFEAKLELNQEFLLTKPDFHNSLFGDSYQTKQSLKFLLMKQNRTQPNHGFCLPNHDYLLT